MIANISMHRSAELDLMHWLQDGINMQINNLARDNLHVKLDTLSDLITDEFWPWFANYMVVKRAAQVSNIRSSCCGTGPMSTAVIPSAMFACCVAMRM